MFCKKCGKELREDEVFCSGCGTEKNGSNETAALKNGNVQKREVAVLTGKDKAVAILKSCIALFVAVCMLALPALKMLSYFEGAGTSNPLGQSVSGYQSFTNANFSFMIREGSYYDYELVKYSFNEIGIAAAIITALCIAVGVALFILGLIGLIKALKGKKVFQKPFAALIITAITIAVAYLAVSLGLRAGFKNLVFEGDGGYIDLIEGGGRLSTESIGGFIAVLAATVLFFIVSPIAKAVASSGQNTEKMTKPQKVTAILTACTAIFMSVWLFIVPALSVYSVKVPSISMNGISFTNGYKLLKNPLLLNSLNLRVGSTIGSGQAGLITVVSLCLSVASFTMIFGVLSLITAIKGRKSKAISSALTAFIVLSFLMTAAYMTGSLVVRSDYNRILQSEASDLESLFGIFPKVGSGSIAGFVLGALIMTLYFVIPSIVNACKKLKIFGGQKNQVTAGSIEKTTDALLEELAKLKKLSDDGILTQEEVTLIKKELLSEKIGKEH